MFSCLLVWCALTWVGGRRGGLNERRVPCHLRDNHWEACGQMYKSYNVVNKEFWETAWQKKWCDSWAAKDNYHSYPERNFQIFTTPYIHACIILTKFIEVISIYCKQSSSHGGWPVRMKQQPQICWTFIFPHTCITTFKVDRDTCIRKDESITILTFYWL